MSIDPKDLYEQNATTYRYFLDWRAKLLAGYFATLVSLSVALAWAFDRRRNIVCMGFSFLGAVISLVFWRLERRNREQYRDCMHVGAGLERQFPLNRPEVSEPSTSNVEWKGFGSFVQIDYESKISHSKALDLVFDLPALIFAAIGLFFGLSDNPFVEPPK